ncbi:MAG: yoeB [Candidatus Peribacteria bacterium]|nr:yoeB [Candidatus Peribacteria bacterium]
MDIQFTESALRDYEYWKKTDDKKTERIKKLCADIQKKPFEGIGKPEPLKFSLQGYWSRRIDKIHRLIYKINDATIVVISCRYHY